MLLTRLIDGARETPMGLSVAGFERGSRTSYMSPLDRTRVHDQFIRE